MLTLAYYRVKISPDHDIFAVNCKFSPGTEFMKGIDCKHTEETIASVKRPVSTGLIGNCFLILILKPHEKVPFEVMT